MFMLLQRGFGEVLLGRTFSWAIFVGNGLAAILAGLASQTLVETLGLGLVAPFDAAALIMICGGVIVLLTWTENYGDCCRSKSFFEQLRSGTLAIANGETPAARLQACAMTLVGLCYAAPQCCRS